MRINREKSLNAITELSSGQILEVKKEKGEYYLKRVPKKKLTFCQKLWKWLGFSGRSFHRVLKVIQEVDIKEKADYSILQGKIKKYKPILHKKLRTNVLNKIAKAHLSLSSTPPKAHHRPKTPPPLSSTSVPDTEHPKVQSKDIGKFITKLTNLENAKQLAEFVKEFKDMSKEQQRQFYVTWQPLDTTATKLQQAGLIEQLDKLPFLWAQFICERVISPTPERVVKFHEALDKSELSATDKLESIDETYLEGFVNFISNYSYEETQPLMKHLADLLVTWGKRAETELSPFQKQLVALNALCTQQKLSKEESPTFERLLLIKGPFFGKFGSPQEMAKELDFSEKPLPRWKKLLQGLSLEKPSLEAYTKELNPETEKDLILAVRQTLSEIYQKELNTMIAELPKCLSAADGIEQFSREFKELSEEGRNLTIDALVKDVYINTEPLREAGLIEKLKALPDEPWAQELYFRATYTPTLEDIEKHVKRVEESGLPPYWKLKVLDESYLEKFSRAIDKDTPDYAKAMPLIQKLSALLKALETKETPLTAQQKQFLTLASFLTEEDPQFSVEEVHTFESLLLGEYLICLHGLPGTQCIKEKANKLDFQGKDLPRWKELLKGMFCSKDSVRDLGSIRSIDPYIKKLDPETEKDLLILAHQKKNKIFCESQPRKLPNPQDSLDRFLEMNKVLEELDSTSAAKEKQRFGDILNAYFNFSGEITRETPDVVFFWHAVILGSESLLVNVAYKKTITLQPKDKDRFLKDFPKESLDLYNKEFNAYRDLKG